MPQLRQSNIKKKKKKRKKKKKPVQTMPQLETEESSSKYSLGQKKMLSKANSPK
jgi:hypothetical protein